MAQYYYEKYHWLDYWDTNNSGNVIATETLKNDSVIRTAATGNTKWLETSGEWSNYSISYRFYENYTSHGFISYGIAESYTDVTFDNVEAGDYIYNLESDGLHQYRIRTKDTFYVDLRVEDQYILELENYTIYHHQGKGSYIETIVANDGAYPDDGYQSGYYWVKGDMPTVTLANIGDKTVDEGQTLSFTTTANIDGNISIIYNIEGLPDGANFDEATGQFSWQTDYYSEGTYEVTFTATANSSTDSETISITVNHVDIDPYIEAIVNKILDENTNLNFTVNVINPDNIDTTLNITGLPNGASFDETTGRFSWTPTYFQAGNYQVAFELTYSSGSDSETITIEVIEIHQPPINRSPAQNYETNDRRPYFEFVLPDNYETDNYKYHARLRISTTTDMNNLVVELDSKDDQSQWELWDDANSEWIGFPAVGVGPDSKVRARPEYALNYGLLYWDCASWEISFGYGKNSAYWKFNVLISTSKPYVLDVAGTSYDVYSITCSETSNGEIGNIDFSVNNQEGLAYQNINNRDTVILAVNDEHGNQEQFRGIVKVRKPSGGVLQVSAITGDGILSERRVKEDYIAQDIGLTAKQIIDTYCSPLTSNNINTNTGIIAPINAMDKTPLKVFEEIRRQYGIYYFVDANWDMNFYLNDEITNSDMTVRYGD